MDTPTTPEELSHEQLIRLALDTRETTIAKLTGDGSLAPRVDDVRRNYVREYARANVKGLLQDLAEASLACDDVAKKAQTAKLFLSVAEYDAKEVTESERVTLILNIGGQRTEVTAGPEPAIEGEAAVISAEHIELLLPTVPEPVFEPKPTMSDDEVDAAFSDLLD